MDKKILEREIEEIVLKNLGVTKEEYQSWFTKEYKVNEKVLKEFAEIVKQSDEIRIVGDYDVDGICSVYIMIKLMEYGFNKSVNNINYVIPRRMSEGYGIKESVINRLYEKDKELFAEGKRITLITVDNGIAGYDAIEYAKGLGYRIIVTDHHELGMNRIPDAEIVINPKVSSCNPFEYNGYCGAMVAYKIAEPFIQNDTLKLHLRIMASLATVADVMELREENYVAVKESLTALKEKNIPKSLKYIGNLSPNFTWENITEKDFGFLFAPIMNASGRLKDNGAQKVEEYLLNPSEKEAKELIEINEERKALVKIKMQEIEEQLKDKPIKSPLWIYQSSIPEGIVGILAGKIVEEYHVPCILLTNTEKEGILKGSGRSTSNFNLYEYLNTIDKSIYVGFGGHSGAAGISIYQEGYENIVLKLPDLGIKEELKNKVDMELDIDDIPNAWEILRNYAPYGEGNSEITFQVDIKDNEYKLIGQNQNTLCVNGTDTAVKLICFDYKKHTQHLDINDGFSMIGSLSLNTFRDKSGIQMLANRIAPPLEKVLEK